MDEQVKKYLFDISVSIKSIDDYLDGKRDFNLFKANKILKRAIEREFEIIGEAISKVLKLDNTLSISNARNIIDLRNHIIHSYDTVIDEIIWGIIIKHLPKLKAEIDKLLT